ncbi:aldehyde dehydrogenase [Pseudohalocynthiibacter aestuariivivens]|jgi:(Z)-2-((N-methylformamido)methylene)-5-hydroxybutyrolactone dehydrogenase|uniref:Aldehyde dehydrogenase n=1 Tax=Pseudohalocynthiibacter aestuariivivens TaxID=1591409 RepID=A0ABV5JA63_9RHOB|nr:MULTISPECIES: aldehyde dehydrogenase [Pseudohalocynthiibacter]MBS9716919.1 aldehyde dehydrogenase [Pseudohalocynthiibacter aestuariivivens]MCK0101987.1 aldehyde dehydrogenase [Pseudohalocynthiibacter sp. F2068]
MTDIQTYQMLIDGDWVDASDGKTFDSINPTTGKVWSRAPEATAEDVDRAVRSAHHAFTKGPWASMTPTERGKHLRRLADLLAEKSEELGRTESIDTGKMLKETRWQAKYIAEFFHFYAGCADKISGETLPIDKPDLFVFTNREPLGVVAAIVPWNSQLFLVAVKMGPALAAGNTVVLKASEHASAAMLEFGKLIEQAGFPAGVVNIMTGHGDPCGKALTSHPLVARISFTGGPNAARHVLYNSAENFAEVSLELGGKSPFIVFDDANIESAVNGSIAGIFGATGQSCVAGSRLYLHEDIADEFLEKMTEMARNIVIGDPLMEETQMGPLCTTGQLENIEREVAHAQTEGGQLLCGGKRPEGMGGLYYEPTIIACPRQDMRIVDTELFGPVLSVLRFRDEDEVIELANDTVHGLAAGIFTQDSARSLRMAKAVRAGIVWVNTYRVVSPIAEFGGIKGSGYGRESGFQAMYDYTRPKTVWMNTSSEPISNPFVMR